MKKILVLLVLGVIGCSPSKIIPTPKGVSSIIKTEFTKNKNYIKANEWMVVTFVDATSVIEFSDKEAGIVKGKYLIKKQIPATQYTAPVEGKYALITVKVKDNATKIEIDPLNTFYSHVVYGKEIGYTPDMFNLKANELIDGFIDYLATEKDNW